MSRAPSRPPELTGYSVIRHLGGGGFADVFLYHQKNLDRDVAVKVLLASDSSPTTRKRFEAEGQVMARLSEAHQNIVPVYDAAICSDGRPYLVMQYCPRDDLAKRYKTAPIPVTDVLSIGVQLAGAVESAHRQGILHRDIKPANVLTNRYGRPALTDFGISVPTSAADDPDSIGVSIPWSPPELLADEPTGDVRSDVYSLTATLYTLLARRSPFEIPGKSNELVDLLSRIPRTPVMPTNNPQTPRSLERVLARGLAKDPSLRYPSALVLARALQEVETELNGSVTNFEFLDENPTAALAEIPGELADHTRIRPIVIRAQSDRQNSSGAGDFTSLRTSRRAVDPNPVLTSAQHGVPSLRPDPGAGGVEHTRMRAQPTNGGYLDPQYLSEPTPVDTVVPVRAESTTGDPPLAPKKSKLPVVVVVGAGLIVAGALAWIVVGKGTDAPPVTSGTTTPVETALAIDAVVPAPTGLTGKPTADGVVFRWSNPDPQPGDTFDWSRSEPGAEETATRVTEPTATVAGVRTACISVVIVRDNGSSSAHDAQFCVGQ